MLYLKGKSAFSKLFLFSLFLSFIFLGLVWPGVSHAADTWEFLANMLATPVYWLAGLVGELLNLVIYFFVIVAQYNDIITADPVQKGWVIVRDLCNMFFVVVLLVIAFGTVLKIETYHYKRLLPKFLLMAILINFSKTIAGLFIDAAQIIMLTFVAGFVSITGGNLINALQVSKYLTFKEGGGFGTGATLFASAVLALIAIIIALIVVVIMTIILVFRIVALWILVILSPLAYLLSIVPAGQKYSSQWWQQFTKYLIVGPIMAFFLWLSLTTASTVSQQIVNTTGKVTPGEAPTGQMVQTGLGRWDVLGSYIIGICLLVGSLVAAQQMGVAGGKMAGDWASKIQRSGVAIGTRPLKWTDRWLAGGAKVPLLGTIGGKLAAKGGDTGVGALGRLMVTTQRGISKTSRFLSPTALVAGYKGWQAKKDEVYERATGEVQDFFTNYASMRGMGRIMKKGYYEATGKTTIDEKKEEEIKKLKEQATIDRKEEYGKILGERIELSGLKVDNLQAQIQQMDTEAKSVKLEEVELKRKLAKGDITEEEYKEKMENIDKRKEFINSDERQRSYRDLGREKWIRETEKTYAKDQLNDFLKRAEVDQDAIARDYFQKQEADLVQEINKVEQGGSSKEKDDKIKQINDEIKRYEFERFKNQKSGLSTREIESAIKNLNKEMDRLRQPFIPEEQKATVERLEADRKRYATLAEMPYLTKTEKEQKLKEAQTKEAEIKKIRIKQAAVMAPRAYYTMLADRKLEYAERQKLADVKNAEDLIALLDNAINQRDKAKIAAISKRLAEDANDNEFLNHFGLKSGLEGMHKFADKLTQEAGYSEQEAYSLVNDISYINESRGHWGTARAFGVKSGKFYKLSEKEHTQQAVTEMMKLEPQTVARTFNRLAYGYETPEDRKFHLDKAGLTFLKLYGKQLAGQMNRMNTLTIKHLYDNLEVLRRHNIDSAFRKEVEERGRAFKGEYGVDKALEELRNYNA